MGQSYDSTVSSLAAFKSGFTEKDEALVEMQERNNELQRQVLELEDSLRAKDQLIRARTEAVTLLSADLSAKGKTTADLLEETRAEMRRMQAEFADREAAWREEKELLKVEMTAKEGRITHLREENDR